MAYDRADFSVLGDSPYGIGFHWTTATMPREGEPKPFDEAVADFDVGAFVEQAVEAGAGHVLFTSTHSRHWLCCPNPEVDRLVSGHTCGRDLIGDLAEGLGAAGIRLIVYYNHNLYKHSPDTEWKQAVGFDPLDPPRVWDNWCKGLGEAYRSTLCASKWSTFGNSDDPSKDITINTLFKTAREHDWPGAGAAAAFAEDIILPDEDEPLETLSPFPIDVFNYLKSFNLSV